MPHESLKPIIISPVTPTGMPKVSRSISVKRLARLRTNWFTIGAVSGVLLTLLLNLLANAVVSPAYESVVAYLNTPPAVETAATTTPVQPVQATSNTASSKAKPATPITYPVTLALKVDKGDTLLDMLVENRVQTSEAQSVINALKSKVNPHKLRIGQRISVTLQRHETLGDRAAVKELAIKLPNLSTVELQRLQSGGFSITTIEETSPQKTIRGFGKVRTSLLQAAADGGIPSAAMREVLKAFSYDIDFQREIHPGDTIEVLMDRNPAKKGGYALGGGNVRYAALVLQGTKHEIFRFKDSYGNMAWFDGKGVPVKKSLLRTPVDAVHITSGFGMRTHPIMGYTKMHRGVDFGADKGTPIMAAGDGTVTFRGWKGGYGNFVTIKHNGKYETAYGHMSRFGKIKVGSRVKQGQIIGFVGMTGMATGPHLHYEVREAGNQVNPVSKQFNMAASLSGKRLAAFKTAKQSALNELASLAKAQPQPQMASAR